MSKPPENLLTFVFAHMLISHDKNGFGVIIDLLYAVSRPLRLSPKAKAENRNACCLLSLGCSNVFPDNLLPPEASVAAQAMPLAMIA